MNPCPCGYLGHRTIACRCTPDQVARYHDRISGPLLDRIDLRVEMTSFTEEALVHLPDGEPTRFVAERVRKVYDRALSRQGKPNDQLGSRTAGRLRGRRAAKELLHAATAARVVHARVPPGPPVARTIADLSGAADIATQHVAEAIQYRRALRDSGEGGPYGRPRYRYTAEWSRLE